VEEGVGRRHPRSTGELHLARETAAAASSTGAAIRRPPQAQLAAAPVEDHPGRWRQYSRHDAMLGSGRVGARQREAVNMRFANGVGSGAMSPGSAVWAAARCLLVQAYPYGRN